MNPRIRTLIALTALAFFALGLLVAGLLAGRGGAESTDRISPVSSAPRDRPSSAPDVPQDEPITDAGAPRILFDPSSITLLPDASLHLEMPPSFDAGSSP